MSEYRLSEENAYLFDKGTDFRLHERLGAHLAPDGNGCLFGVWASNAI
jgi:1,4-alpha-glucan branching enzyme